MAKVPRIVYAEGGIATAKEGWLFPEKTSTSKGKWHEELTREDEIRRERMRAARDYARKLAVENARRTAELEAVREHGRKLGAHAELLQQQVEEREREQAKAREAFAQLEAEFRALADQWRRETRILSSDSDIAANFAYHQIMGMGEKALPLIFRDLQERGGRWFWALRAITRQNPVRPEDRGNVRKMVDAWLTWGRQHDYV